MDTDTGLIAEPTVTAKRKRRWFQYSLRTLLLLMLLFGVGLGWFAREVRQSRAYRQAVMAADIARMEAEKQRMAAEQQGMVAAVAQMEAERAARKTVAEKAELEIQQLSGRVTGLDLSSTKVTDAGLIHLEGLTQLQTLNLGSTSITDAGLAHLKGLTKLQELDLSSTKVTDAGVAELKKVLPKVKIER
ncbi:MAG: hypothetical protein NTY19_46660 [Planctomycetota bacterium]|nr:hypothetical protein [Planctomycetota bacterium]